MWHIKMSTDIHQFRPPHLSSTIYISFHRQMNEPQFWWRSCNPLIKQMTKKLYETQNLVYFHRPQWTSKMIQIRISFHPAATNLFFSLLMLTLANLSIEKLSIELYFFFFCHLRQIVNILNRNHFIASKIYSIFGMPLNQMLGVGSLADLLFPLQIPWIIYM